MENQIEKKMGNELETWFIWGIIGIRVSQNWVYHFMGSP